ncbi:oxalate:formate antiporter [Clonorchis sinensis]|uniref:Oxalate:formate antiporter n=1 Tax=Clonorchis sinensis TaxID=79923 RepID=G7YWA6_CLOSI|nr:oxalate:formate antiporter [Clonorchis sinensis]
MTKTCYRLAKLGNPVTDANISAHSLFVFHFRSLNNVRKTSGIFLFSPQAEKEDRHEMREEKKRLTGPENTAGDSDTKQTSQRCSTGSLKEPWSTMAPERQPPEDENLTPAQVLRRCDFYRMWVIMFCNIIPITIITSAYKYFGQAYISDDFFLSIVATISAIFNAGGRVMWGAFVDKVSFKIPLCTMLVAWSTILFTFPHLRYLEGSVLKAFYAVWVCLLFISLSGVFAIMPTATGTLFGPERMAINYGLVFSAFAFGSVTCSIINTLVSSKGAYVMQFTGCGCVCLVAFFIALSLTDKKMNPRYDVFRSCKNRCNC